MTPGDSRIEPDTVADTDDGHCLHSIAISLKRIADALEALKPPVFRVKGSGEAQ